MRMFGRRLVPELGTARVARFDLVNERNIRKPAALRLPNEIDGGAGAKAKPRVTIWGDATLNEVTEKAVAEQEAAEEFQRIIESNNGQMPSDPEELQALLA